MRILHVNKFLYRRGGAEGYLFDLSARQRARGHDVAYFAMHHPDNEPSSFEDWFPDHLELDPAPAGFLAKAAAAGRMVWSSTAARGMQAVLERFRPDVVHLHNVYHQLSPSVLAPVARAGVASVMTLHDYKLVCPSYQLLAGGEVCEACIGGSLANAVRRRCKDGSLTASSLLALETSLHRRTDAYGSVGVLIAPSRFLAGRLEAAGVGGTRLRHIPHFVDPAVAVGPRSVQGPGATPVVAYAGRLAPEKGVDVLVRAVREVPDVQLEIAGDGPDRDRLERAARWLLADRVRFHGRVSRTGVQQLLGRATVAVVPSRWHENQPLAVLEAFSCGVPVVATRLGGLPELVQDGRTGVLVPHDDPVALAAALCSLTSEPAWAAAMGARARRWAIEHHDPDRHLDAVELAYAAAGARRAGPAGVPVARPRPPARSAR